MMIGKFHLLPVEAPVFQGTCSKCGICLELSAQEAETEGLREDRGRLHADLENGWIHVECPSVHTPPQPFPKVGEVVDPDAPAPEPVDCKEIVTLYRVEPQGAPA